MKGIKMSRNMSNAKGFTLIELLIVVAIIGILAAIAIPQYQTYVGKSEASTGLSAISALKTPTEAWVLEKGYFPKQAEIADLGVTQPSVGAITVNGDGTAVTGTITITFNATSAALNTATLIMERDANGAWSCTGGTIAAKYQPKGCS
ncbi:pilin [Shewanella insulae]|uniref:pilin n=1 Tax=Shewanella insulae TaxID=2681496 RepID=UPI0024808DD5|nr:pilin [Shewanella insulae]